MHLYKVAFLSFCCIVMIGATSFTSHRHNASQLDGAWVGEAAGAIEVLLFVDGYFSHTAYDVQGKKFLYTYGGSYKASQNAVIVLMEFDTRQSENVGRNKELDFVVTDDVLQLETENGKKHWRRAGDASALLSGAWHITQRMQDGQLQTIHQSGTRKTIKLLAGSRFQWVAIDPGVKGFYGTGGGTYTFTDGQYTEQILFFSRDSSRVGASLRFNGKLEGGKWHHSGKSSKGDDIYEVWSRVFETK